MVAFVNDSLVDAGTATLGISDVSIHRGYGIFDYFRTVGDVPLFFDDYLDRFFGSAAQLRLQPVQSLAEIKSIIAEMIRVNNIGSSGFKLLLTGGYSEDGFQPGTPNLVVIQQPLQLSTDSQFSVGYHIITHEYLRDLPYAKSINYMMGIYLRETIDQANADDVLYHAGGNILELSRSNVFIVTRHGVVVTPRSNVLPGITRKKVLEIAEPEFKTAERDVSMEELLTASEVFLTSTTKRILPILSINGKPVGDGTPGTITTALYRRFLQAETSYVQRHTPSLIEVE